MPSNHSFGHFEIHADQRRLLVGGAEVKVGARAFDLLLALIDRRERVVSKDELLQAVWPGLVVEENNLVVQVGSLRRLLGADVIATVPGRGYRLTAALTATAVASNAPAPIEQDRPAAPTPQAQRTLPRLFGRADELVTLRSLSASHSVVTVIGAGGIGKTHLVRHLLQQEAVAVETCFVDLSTLPAADAATLPRMVAAALGIQLGPGDAAQAVAEALGARHVLLALDNAEHLVDAVASLAAQLVQRCPALRLVATSQAPMGVPGERLFRIGGLALPDGPAGTDEAMDYGAVALFVDRAQAAHRGFELTEENLSRVVDLCHRLDGMPLAIELAASRLGTLGLSGLSAAIEQRMLHLGAGRRLAPLRQQTLQAALDWSHGLLDEREQTVFRRLSVFIGPFALPTAQQVAADERIDTWSVVEALAALVDRSLVAVTDAEPPRYRLLDAPRAHSRGRLEAAREEHDVARRHAQALAAQLAAADAAWLDGRIGVDEFRSVVRPDLADGRAALGWAIAHDSALAVALVPALDWAMVNEPPGAARREQWDRTLPLLNSSLPAALHARWWMGWFSWVTLFGGGGTGSGIGPELRQRALAEVRDLGDRRALHWMLRGRMWLLTTAAAGDAQALAEARQVMDEMRALAEPAWSAVHHAMRMRAESELCSVAGDHLAAIAWLRRAAALAVEAGDARARHSAMVALSDAHLGLQQFDEAARSAAELIDALRATPFESTLTYARHNLALAHIWRRDFSAARAAAHDAWALSIRFQVLGLLANNLALLAAFEGRFADAARLAGYADEQNRQRGEDRQSNEARAVGEALHLATEALGAERCAALQVDGALLTVGELRLLSL